tara:strand:+ start:677 stop:1126 length:450 start_codon:yes stop_codon:yes gene_type:complete
MSNLQQIEEEKSTHLEDVISDAINKLHTASKKIVDEFIEDGLVSSFKDIDKLTWYNFISSLCVIVRRFDEIKNNEKAKETVVFKTIRLIIEKDIPIDEKKKKDVLKIFDTIAPSIIDVLIPGKREPGQPLSLPEKVINKVCKLCGCGKL